MTPRAFLRRIGAVAVSVAILAACEQSAPQIDPNPVDIPVDSNAATRFAPSSRMHQIAAAGTVRIAVKVDQPGLGYKPSGQDTPVGFDIEIAKMLAAKLGIPADKVRWVPTESDQRERLLTSGKVDLVVASYSLSDARRKVVGQAGPYFITGQRLLVKRGSRITGPDDIKGKTVCAVKASSALQTVRSKGARAVAVASTPDCRDRVLNGSVAAGTADGGLLLGYAAQQPKKLKVVGAPMTRERYGVGYPKSQPEMCSFITETIEAAEQDGLWAKAYAATLGKAGGKTPPPPELDECP